MELSGDDELFRKFSKKGSPCLRLDTLEAQGVMDAEAPVVHDSRGVVMIQVSPEVRLDCLDSSINLAR